jgi:hypothetical protein
MTQRDRLQRRARRLAAHLQRDFGAPPRLDVRCWCGSLVAEVRRWPASDLLGPEHDEVQSAGVHEHAWTLPEEAAMKAAFEEAKTSGRHGSVRARKADPLLPS